MSLVFPSGVLDEVLPSKAYLIDERVADPPIVDVEDVANAGWAFTPGGPTF